MIQGWQGIMLEDGMIPCHYGYKGGGSRLSKGLSNPTFEIEMAKASCA